MDDSLASATTESISLPEELILMLLNEKNGYFHQVPGWTLNCAVVGAVLAELSFLSRIDTDLKSLHLVDATPTGDPMLDPMLKRIAESTESRNTHYWIERLAVHADSVVDSALESLVSRKILKHHEGGFWTLARADWSVNADETSDQGTAGSFVRARIARAIFTQEIPGPRDIIIICLVNSCDILRFIFELDEGADERIRFICNLELIGRSIADAVEQSIASPLLKRSSLNKRIPTVSVPRLLLDPHLRDGNVPALLANLAKQYGPVFEFRRPFAKPIIFLAGAEINRWVHRNGRMHLRTKDYFADFEQVYGASGVLPSLDGSDHFRLRRAMSPAYSRGRLASQLDQLYYHTRRFMSEWTVGESYSATPLCRRMINAQFSNLAIDIDSQDVFDDLVAYKERALNVHIIKALPSFLLRTPGMKRKAASVDMLLKRVQSVHTPAQRAGCPRSLADDVLGLHESDPQLVPESNLRFALSAALIASVYLGDALSFAVYAMTSRPELYARIRSEADALFENGDPTGDELNPPAIDVTKRFLTECLRMYPIVPGSLRDVMNSFEIEGYEIPVGSRIFVAQTATHYMEGIFPDPHSFDIDRYTPTRNEQQGPGYAPYGLGTHTCLGLRWLELQMTVNVLMIARHFTLEISPNNYKLKFNPFPSMKPTSKLKFRIAEKRHEVTVGDVVPGGMENCPAFDSRAE